MCIFCRLSSHCPSCTAVASPYRRKYNYYISDLDLLPVKENTAVQKAHPHFCSRLAFMITTQVNFAVRAPTTLFKLYFADLDYSAELEKFSSSGAELRNAYRDSLRSMTNDSSLDVQQVRPGSIDIICTTRQPLITFKALAAKELQLDLPKVEKSASAVLRLPLAVDTTLNFDRPQDLIEYVEDRKHQNILAQRMASALPSPVAAASPSSAAIGSLPAVHKTTKETLEAIVEVVLESIGLISLRTPTTRYTLDEDDDGSEEWTAAIIWGNTSKDRRDWVSVLVYGSGVHLGSDNRERNLWIPFDTPHWQQVLTSAILPLLGGH